MKRIILFLLCAFAAFSLQAQNFPSRTVTLTVGFAPGGGTDTAARIVAKKLSENIGQTVVVENRAGAGGNIAAQHIATAPPDGYTIHLTSVGPMTVAPAMVKNLPYDAKKDIAPITMGMVFPNVFVVPPTSPAKNLQEFVALAKSKPGEITYASSGIGGAAHLSGELLKQRAGIDMTHVPYKGGGPAMTDMLGGRVDMYPAVPSTSEQHVKSGKVRAIATTGAARLPTLPDVPTVAEQGFPGFEALSWFGLMAPAGTPRAIINKVQAEAMRVLADGDQQARFAQMGLDPMGTTPEAMHAMIAADLPKWARVIAEAGIAVGK